jgi:LPS sulfotransferase NodH
MYSSVPDTIPDVNRTIVLATQRSGSTYLCERLYAQGFGRGNEHILDYVLASEHSTLQSGHYTDQLVSRFKFDEFIDKGMDHDHYCTKVMANYMHSFCGLLRNSLAMFEIDQQAVVLKDVFGRANYLFLYRSNRIAQAISRIIAAQTGVWHRTEAGTTYVDSALAVDAAYNHIAIFRPLDISDQVNAILDEERRLRSLQGALTRQGIATVAVLYDGARFLPTGENSERPTTLITALASIQFMEVSKNRPLVRLSNVYNHLFEMAYYNYLGMAGVGGTGLTIPQRREATLAAVAATAELDADWARMQIDAINSEMTD